MFKRLEKSLTKDMEPINSIKNDKFIDDNEIIKK